MYNFTKNDLELFKRIARLNQKNLKDMLERTLVSMGYKIDSHASYISAPGTIPVVLVAHMDTVFKAPPTEFFYDEQQGVLWSPDGLGADDRAGVFAILKILGSGLRPHVLFCCDEEIGGLGASDAAKNKNMFEDVRYIIEFDRQGTSDCVFYNCDNDDFIDYVESFGFIEAFGTFSDISLICPAWRVAGVNLSVGYKYEHSIAERLHVRALKATIERAKTMLKQEEIPHFKYISMYKTFWQNILQFDEDDYLECKWCHKWLPANEVTPLRIGHQNFEYACEDCMDAHNMSWCGFCGEPYEMNMEDIALWCPDCRGGFLDEDEYVFDEAKV